MRMRTCLALSLCLLACAGCGKKKSTDQLLEDLKSPEERDRLIAVRLLPERKEDAERVIPALIEALKDRENDIRLSAAIGLGTFGEQAKEAVPALQQIAKSDRDGRVRRAAATAVSRIDPNAAPAKQG
jgi:HEAT repeat protein